MTDPAHTPVKTVLIVEDERAIATMLGDLLEEEGYTTVLAANGLEALEQLAQVPIDLVLSDIMMPRMSGSELCLAIRDQANYAHLPIILMTAAKPPTDLDPTIYQDFITKPFELDVLLAKLRRIFPAL